MSSQSLELSQPIIGIEFGVLSADEIQRMSVTQIQDIELYDGMNEKSGSLMDTIMGTSENNKRCKTCGLTTECPGHFGHINLAEPMFHIKTVDIVKKILGCVCLGCAKLLLPKNDCIINSIINIPMGKDRLDAIEEITKREKLCRIENNGCGRPKSIIKLKKDKDKSEIIFTIDDKVLEDETNENKVVSRKLTSQECYTILSQISDIDSFLLGINPNNYRIENLLLTKYPVAPIQVRPSIRGNFMDSSNPRFDDLTTGYLNIIKINNALKDLVEDVTNKVKEEESYNILLACKLHTLYDSKFLQTGKNKAQQFNSLDIRITGKQGRIRRNLMGKRVNFSARTVITPDPSLDIDQLGVPINIAMKITFPEVVTPYNIDELQDRVNNGPHNYPGANFVFQANDRHGQARVLEFMKGNLRLKFGDIVERHLVDGDIVLLNRQPSLHKLSMMGHKVKVIENQKYESFRLNPSVTTPYNADFDGDEMNIFAPQSYQTQIELSEIVSVEHQLITPASSVPIIGMVQDGLLGSYLLTYSETKMDYHDSMNILSSTNMKKFKLISKDEIHTGTNIYSNILEDNININNKKIKIKNGILSSDRGQLTGAMLKNKKHNSLIHVTWDQYSQKEATNLLNNTQKLINNFLIYNGFSMNIGDIRNSVELNEEIKSTIDEKLLEIHHEITYMENNPSIIDPEIYEGKIYGKLNSIRSNFGKVIINHMDINNGIFVMSESGAKGGADNTAQMKGCLGQQALEGERIRLKYNNRTLPYFPEYDNTPAARGFIKNNFLTGLTPNEFVHAHVAGREGLIDTKIKTADTGYVQRRLVKLMEDMYVAYDNTVRNASGLLLQLSYGDSGLDSTKQIKHDMSQILLNNQELKEQYAHNDEYFEMIKELRNILRKSKTATESDYKILPTEYMLPVNFIQVIDNFRDSGDKSKVISYEYVYENIMKLLSHENSPIYIYKQNSQYKKYDEELVKTVFKFALLTYISPIKCVDEYKLTTKEFDNMIKDIKRGYMRSIVSPGEMVGIIAGQSIGEPVTQLTLNTFHSAGIGDKGTANMGLPRVQELLRTSDATEPITTIYFNKISEDTVKRISTHIKITTINDIKDKIQVFYDPKPDVSRDNIITASSSDIFNYNWLIRIVFNKDILRLNNITLNEIKMIMKNYWFNKRMNDKNLNTEQKNLIKNINGLDFYINSDNDIENVMHIRFNMKKIEMSSIQNFITLFIDTFKIKGINNITDIRSLKVNTENKINYDNDEGIVETNKESILYVDGINLQELRYIKNIDLTRTICNDINIIYKEFGIEAARMAIYKEFRQILSETNFKHILLLVDLMTNYGFLLAIERFGIVKTEYQTLSKVSFEEPVKHFINSAIFSEKDEIKSVSSRIMTGQAFRGGTGIFDLSFNYDLLQNSEMKEDRQAYYNKNEVSQVIEDNIMNDIMRDDEETSGFIVF